MLGVEWPQLPQYGCWLCQPPYQVELGVQHEAAHPGRWIACWLVLAMRRVIVALVDDTM